MPENNQYMKLSATAIITALIAIAPTLIMWGRSQEQLSRVREDVKVVDQKVDTARQAVLQQIVDSQQQQLQKLWDKVDELEEENKDLRAAHHTLKQDLWKEVLASFRTKD